MSVPKEKLSKTMNWMLRVELCPSKIHALKSLCPVAQNVTLFGKRGLADDQVKVNSLGGLESSTASVLIKKETLDTETHVQREDDVKMQNEHHVQIGAVLPDPGTTSS